MLWGLLLFSSPSSRGAWAPIASVSHLSQPSLLEAALVLLPHRSHPLHQCQEARCRSRALRICLTPLPLPFASPEDSPRASGKTRPDLEILQGPSAFCPSHNFPEAKKGRAGFSFPEEKEKNGRIFNFLIIDQHLKILLSHTRSLYHTLFAFLVSDTVHLLFFFLFFFFFLGPHCGIWKFPG